MNPLKLIARVLAPVHEQAGYQPVVAEGSAVLPLGAQMVNVKQYPEAERIAASLREYPGDWGWVTKGHTLRHIPTGFVLWVANEDWGLGERASGVTARFCKEEQAIVWPAVEAWLASHKIGFTGRLPKVSITCRKGTWWCVSEGHPWAGAGGSPAEAYRSWSRAVSIEARGDQRPNEILHVWSAAL
ncbi:MULTISPECIES: hypothetical protein [Pseudomonas]|uniref:hypothetical protein n=1 Tax=Pseudomonas TaxID=286 RepID=UPI0020934A80|nr:MULTISPECIES: hypothetical protein [Pseudomonas]USS54869.1 hypothetical protein NG836_24270 [Pseudomonas kermanshahensis]UVL65058.1 hypothetical protein LOY53_16690 [Pseudomonas sp. B21-031]